MTKCSLKTLVRYTIKLKYYINVEVYNKKKLFFIHFFKNIFYD